MEKIRTLVLILLCTLIAVSSAVHAQDEPTGKILTFDDPTLMKVYIPPSFSDAETYPVLYLLHGQGQDETIWIRLGLPEILDKLILTGRVNPLIVVMPQEKNYLEKVEESDFEKLFTERLIPFINSNFPVDGSRSAHGIGGISRGAFWAQLIALKNYRLFGVLGQHSLLTAYYSTSSLSHILNNAKNIPPMKIWIDIGNEDFYVEETSSFPAQLQALKIPYVFTLNSGKHEEAYWKEHLRDYLQWYGNALEKDEERMN